MPERVPITEAAERLGLSSDTIKRRIKAGQLTGVQEQIAQGHRWLIDLPERSPLDDGSGDSSQVDTLRAVVDLLREQLQAQNEQLAAKDRQIFELHALLRRWWPPGAADAWSGASTRPRP